MGQFHSRAKFLGMSPAQSRAKFLVYAWQSAGSLLRYMAGLRQPCEVWFTFDDGPHPIHTAKILQSLHRHDAKGMFFMIGQNAERHPEIVVRTVDEGHGIGNHSYSHPFLTSLDPAEIEREIMQADAILAPHYKGTKLFRPPHGNHSDMLDEVATKCGYRTIMWNISTRDWHPRFQPQRWVRVGSFLIRLSGGPIIVLMHDLAGTAEHLDDFLQGIKRLGGKFMSPETL